MSLATVASSISAAIADRFVSTEEAEAIVSRADPVLGAPKSVGTFLDKKEHRAIADLYERVGDGEIGATPEARRVLMETAERGPDRRWKHALRGGPLGKKLAVAVGVPVAAFYTWVGIVMIGFPAGLLPAVTFGLFGAAAGYALGSLQSMFDD